MPIYPFTCNCGKKKELEGSVEDLPRPPICTDCKIPMYRDYRTQDTGVSMGDSMCRQSTGYANDWFDAEEYRHKTGQKCSIGAGTDYGFPKDPTTGRIIKRKKPRKKAVLYVP